ncbi:hypothetical protein A1O1_06934 [Capronia coronata CBS 617.96]|uniref:BZIP domain-containing protein n=1 Tax=Capronia coronata CBS 617.96 TaxID=1182541 RepID=W9Y0Z6_9EURO|nr:uncharacterized protein A1O1_06934 [Capronia coronata CBS 617.96]EXJ83315.1 hypothetical protein A1O1_06934 [Capronia coronata CBS 617.96]
MTTHIHPSGQVSSPADSTECKDKTGVSSRRLKKREIDRRCQRQARERTKARISYLEGLVDDFRRQDSSGQVASLMKQLQDVEAERDVLAKTLKDIQKAMDIHKAVKPALEQVQANSIPTSHGMSEAVSVGRKADITPFSDDISLRLKAESVDVRPANIPARSFDLGNYYSPAGHQALVPSKPAKNPVSIPPARYADLWALPRNTCSCLGRHDRDRDRQPGRRFMWRGSYWTFANEVMCERFEWTDVEPAAEATAHDVPVRALLEGWDSVARRGPLHPSWQTLRRIDETLFSTLPNTERLAILRAMHLLLQFHTESTTERYARLPPWYMRRPSQNLAHSYAIDFFAWPGLRERFIFNEHDYCGNEFWHAFRENLRILWPYEFRDCYTCEVETGLYKLSPMFDQRLVDIRSWTMDSDFFRRFPELSSDIPAFNKIPQSVSPRVCPGQKNLLANPSSPKMHESESVYEEEHVEERPPSEMIPVPSQNPQMHLQGHQYPHFTQKQVQVQNLPRQQDLNHPRSQTPGQNLHRPQDMNQHMYDISDLNSIMALDAFAYGAISELDVANAFQPAIPDTYPNVIS